LLDRALGLAVPQVFGPLGIVLVLAVEASPLAYLVIAAGLATRAQPQLERAARASGADAWTAFRTVTLPLLRPVFGAAALISLVVSLTAFGTPAVLGTPAHFTTVTTRIYQDLAFSATPESFARAILLSLGLAVAVTLAVVAASRLLRGPGAGRVAVRTDAAEPMAADHDPGAEAGAAGAAGPVPQGRRLRWMLGIVCWSYVVVGVALPGAALVLTALTRATGLEPTPDHWTLANFTQALDRHAVGALGTSLVLGGICAVAAVVLGLLGAAAVTSGGRGGRLVGPGVLLAFAIPGSTFAVGVLLAYGPLASGSLAIILLAYLGKFWALGLRPISAALERIRGDLMLAARASGAGRWTAGATIVLPLVRPALGAAGLIAFLFALHEITISSLLYGPRSATLGVVVLNLQQLGDPAITAAAAVLMTLLVLAAGVPLLLRPGLWAGAGRRA
jgi:iron(III) transport system permease protein